MAVPAAAPVRQVVREPESMAKGRDRVMAVRRDPKGAMEVDRSIAGVGVAVVLLAGTAAVAGFHRRTAPIQDNRPAPLERTILVLIGMCVVALGAVLFLAGVVVWATGRHRGTDPLRLDRSEEPPLVRRCPNGRTLPEGSIIRNPVAGVDACPGPGACTPVSKGPVIAGLACLVGALLVVLALLSPSSAAPAFGAPGILLLAGGIWTLGVTGGFLVLAHSLGRDLWHPHLSP